MSTLKLERGGKKASLMNRFKVYIDGNHVGDLKKWGHSAEFDLEPGEHTLLVKAMGGVRGEADFAVGADETLDLVVGYPSLVLGVIQGVTSMTGTLAYWEREG